MSDPWNRFGGLPSRNMCECLWEYLEIPHPHGPCTGTRVGVLRFQIWNFRWYFGALQKTFFRSRDFKAVFCSFWTYWGGALSWKSKWMLRIATQKLYTCKGLNAAFFSFPDQLRLNTIWARNTTVQYCMWSRSVGSTLNRKCGLVFVKSKDKWQTWRQWLPVTVVGPDS
jgi:hypothetical protein